MYCCLFEASSSLRCLCSPVCEYIKDLCVGYYISVKFSTFVGDERCNVIMWMDHRAVTEAETINSTRHPLLRSVGGSISLEMSLPKVLWLKKACLIH